jgi:hypothetical protein
VLALCSVEQSFGVPLILFLYAVLFKDRIKARGGMRATLDRLSPHLWTMALYLVFMGAWKTLPVDTYYSVSVGKNVLVNFATYSGWVLQFGATLPSRMATGRVEWSLSHIFFVLLFVYHLAWKRWRQSLFGLGYFLVAISPTLILENHTFYLHTYIPSVGVLYLLGLVADDALSIRIFKAGTLKTASLTVFLAAITVMSFVMVRRNENYPFLGVQEYRRSFVLRRADIAKNIHDGLIKYRPFREGVKGVYMIYGREEGRDTARWNNENIVVATGNGSLVNLLYGRMEMPVVFKIAGDAIPGSNRQTYDLYVFGDFGDCTRFE